MEFVMKLIIAGIVFCGLELIIPGFGVAGVLSIVCFTVAGYFALGGGIAAIGSILLVYLFLFAIVALLGWYLPSNSKWNPFVLWERQKNGPKEEKLLKSYQEHLGKCGETITPLRPAGIMMLDGHRLDVLTEGGFIEPRTMVKIVKVEGIKIFVEVVKED